MEWETSVPVNVFLAGDNQSTMRMTSSGTLLLPPHATESSTIVPVGELWQAGLGYICAPITSAGWSGNAAQEQRGMPAANRGPGARSDFETREQTVS